jgi:hypothetical protein
MSGHKNKRSPTKSYDEMVRDEAVSLRHDNSKLSSRIDGGVLRKMIADPARSSCYSLAFCFATIGAALLPFCWTMLLLLLLLLL